MLSNDPYFTLEGDEFCYEKDNGAYFVLFDINRMQYEKYRK